MCANFLVRGIDTAGYAPKIHGPQNAWAPIATFQETKYDAAKGGVVKNKVEVTSLTQLLAPAHVSCPVLFANSQMRRR